jgi:putative endonuclease
MVFCGNDVKLQRKHPVTRPRKKMPSASTYTAQNRFHHSLNPAAMRRHEYYVYIITKPKCTTLYTGVTNSIARRLVEHYANRGKQKTFAGRYFCYCLVYVETHQYINNAIAREKEIKDWTRERKEALIREVNPDWRFLNEECCGEWPPNKIWGEYMEEFIRTKGG